MKTFLGKGKRDASLLALSLLLLKSLIDAAFSNFPVLGTLRFHLRRIQPSDAEAFFQIKSDPEVTVSCGREPHRFLQDTQAWTTQKRRPGV